jgi:hypothetical protein
MPFGQNIEAMATYIRQMPKDFFPSDTNIFPTPNAGAYSEYLILRDHTELVSRLETKSR